MARDDSFEKFLATQDASGSLKRLLLHRAALRRRARLPRSRQRQFDLGTLFWLIAIFCVCLVVFPAMLGEFERCATPPCLFFPALFGADAFFGNPISLSWP